MWWGLRIIPPYSQYEQFCLFFISLFFSDLLRRFAFKLNLRISQLLMLSWAFFVRVFFIVRLFEFSFFVFVLLGLFSIMTVVVASVAFSVLWKLMGRRLTIVYLRRWQRRSIAPKSQNYRDIHTVTQNVCSFVADLRKSGREYLVVSELC